MRVSIRPVRVDRLRRGRAGQFRVVEEQDNVGVQCSLIAPQRHGVITAPIHNLLSDRPLAVHRIHGDDRVLQRQHRQQFRHRGDLIRFSVRGDLSQHHPLLAAPGTDHV